MYPTMYPTMYPHTRGSGLSPDAPTPSFTDAELSALTALRSRYAQNGDCFDTCELAHLRFLRWLCQTGRLTA